MSIQPSDIIGAWHLVDTYILNPDGTHTLTQGPEPTGIVLYTADGYMNAITRWGTREFPASKANEDKARMFDTYLSYAGRWTLDGNTVTHHIEHALDPNTHGLERKRDIEYQGDRMVYSGLAASDGISKGIVVWQRAPIGKP